MPGSVATFSWSATMRGLETMQMRVTLSLSVMLEMACTSIREGQPQRMRSLILPLAA